MYKRQGLEDDKNLDNVNFNMEIFQAFTKGYLESGKSFLLPIEIENLPYAAALFPYMQCVRFLADYINGDTCLLYTSKALKDTVNLSLSGFLVVTKRTPFAPREP